MEAPAFPDTANSIRSSIPSSAHTVVSAPFAIAIVPPRTSQTGGPQSVSFIIATGLLELKQTVNSGKGEPT